MDLVLRGLGAGADDELVDVDVRRARDHPDHGIGDVLRDERLRHSGVHLRGALCITAVAEWVEDEAAATPLGEDAPETADPGAQR